MFRKFVLSVALAAATTVVAPLTGQASAAEAPITAAAVTVYYDTSSAPTFASAIRQGAANWNARVSNVKLVENRSAASLRYREGNDPRGSYASTNGHGSGTIFIDYTQARQYYVTRITAHETGHALGLPDHYSGPCSELMSGGGPGTSCTVASPNSTEAARVNSLWANGFAGTYEWKVIYEQIPVHS
ncbi:snapalysin family zinc-dependent metalloprotease [Lentzea sp. NBC_00516]|uniref:snapalysin family zinc-dependent metalloprotease n=1 Tax=Lentzea sp. NBC_00516 TaxID=2903582 RepID=UPI002E810D7E|nr:snapalysin family zinc-dependent metalloprotease [Lentzea sp. NBC_00516]WUD27654.1 snapalysin family zinc-dependent metalloprotease [Lentzea sp. NBC_00516]